MSVAFQFKEQDVAHNASPLSISDPWGQGWIFNCVTADSRLFVALQETPKGGLKAIRLLGKAAKSEQLRKWMDGKGSTDDFAEMSDEEMELFSSLTETIGANKEEMGKCPDKEKVAKLLVGWSGINGADGNAFPFSRLNALSLLGDKEVLDEDGSPLRIPSGQYMGYTLGEALRFFLPEAIMSGTNERRALVEDTEKNS